MKSDVNKICVKAVKEIKKNTQATLTCFINKMLELNSLKITNANL